MQAYVSFTNHIYITTVIESFSGEKTEDMKYSYTLSKWVHLKEKHPLK